MTDAAHTGEIVKGQLRDRMIGDLRLRGLGATTRET
jgi:hypothetical protein